MTKPGFTWVTPVVFVRDLVAGLAHYERVLGFERVWQWSDTGAFDAPEHPTFACIRRGECSLFLSQRPDMTHGGMVCLNVASGADLQALFAEYKSSGADVVDEPQDRSFGMRDMVVQDLDGNALRIGLTVEEVKSCA